VLKPQLMIVGCGVVSQIEDREVRELAARNPGIGLACCWLEEARPATGSDFDQLPVGMRYRIFLWDLLCLNVDRTADNPNALVAGCELWLFDFSATLEFRRIIGRNIPGLEETLDVLADHPLRHPRPDISVLMESIQMLRKQDLATAVHGIPDGWLEAVTGAGNLAGKRQSIARQVEELLVEAPRTIEQRHGLLRKVKPESAPEKLARIAANRRRFLDGDFGASRTDR
jgi:hypothetical protein